ncbi:MAG: DUF4097 domain-containing protein [Terriglobales bacterium]
MQRKVAIRSKLITVAAMLALVFPVAAQQRTYREGATWVEETSGFIPSSSALSVRLGMGNVSVTGGPQPNITYQLKKRVRTDSESAARRQFEQFRFTAGKSGDTAVLEGVWSGGRARYFTAELSVQVPRGTGLVKLVTHGGNESVVGVNGRVEATTGGGNVRLDQIGGPVHAVTGGGNVEVGSANSELTVKTGGGNIRINSANGRVISTTGGGNIIISQAAQAVTASTGGGDIAVSRSGGELMANTGGGSLELGHVGGKAVLRSGGGSIRLAGANGPVIADTGGGGVELHGLTQGADVRTGGGEIVAEFLGANFGGSTLQTPAGDIVVYLGPELKASIRASIQLATGHRIHSEFPEIRVNSEGGQYGPKMVFAEGNLNGGGPTLRVITTSGDIDIRRAKR